MPWIDIKYELGTQKAPQQTKLSAGAFTDTDHVHAPEGRVRSMPPYALRAVTNDYVSILGGLRSIHATKLTGTSQGTYYFYGTNTALYVEYNGGLYNITPLVTTGVTLGNNPLATADTTAVVTVTYTAHGLAVGDRIRLSGATNVGGIDAATYINIEHIVTTVPTANTFTIIVGTDATSTTSGGGASVEIFKQIAAGNLSQDLATGYGAGIYGAGLYGQGGPAVSAQIYPRIWSFGNFGNDIVMCPGDYTAGDGQKIYIWDGDTDVAPTVLSNAPTDCNWLAVINNAIVALCGRTIKISEIGGATVWTGPTTYQKTLERIWKAVAAYNVGEKGAVIFSPTEALLLRYVGGGDLWDIADLFLDDGIIGPQAACTLNTVLYWRGTTAAYAFDGGSPVQTLDNPQNEDWQNENINYGKAWKCFAYSDPQNNEWYFHFPAGVDSEPNDYVIHNPRYNSWWLGSMERTAAQRPNAIDTIFVVANGISESVPATIYRHFANGAPTTFTWFAESAFAYAESGENRYGIDEMTPDSNQGGTVNVILTAKEWPQGSTVSSPTYTVTASTQRICPKIGGRLISIRWGSNNYGVLGAWKMNVRRLGQ